MPDLEIDGVGTVEVGDEFFKLTPERQAIEVDSIVSAIKGVNQPVQPAQPQPAQEQNASLSVADVAKGAVTNLPSSAVQFGKDIAQPVLHPIDTAIALKNIGAGVLQKIGILSGEDSEKYADAVGKFFVDRYGSSEGIKNAIATDPVGVIADVATVLTGGGAVAARAPGVAGKVGRIAQKAGTIIDPVNVAVKGAKIAGRGAASVIGGLGTGTGGESIRAAARAGAEGGTAADTFVGNMRGKIPIDDVVSEASAALNKMRVERGIAYRAEMAKIGQDTQVLDFGKIDKAISDVQKVKTYKGQNLSPSTEAIRKQITDAVDAWKALDPAEFHTAEGLDALKQQIGDIRDATKFGTPDRVVANSAYNAVRQTIVDQVPEYAKVMKAYEEASDLIKDIEKTLSLSPSASIDTSVRKLQSVLRNNVNTNYGRREVLADYLVKAGATNLTTALAGQALNSLTPRGMNRLFAQIVAAGGGASLLSGVGTIPGLVAMGLVPFTSPRTVGEAAFAIGKASRKAAPAGRASFQLGRSSALEDRQQ